ncbi:MAG: BatA domain-containing protein, partial [bacterium]
MIRFAHIEYLYLLGLVPVLLLLYLIVGRVRKKALGRFGSLDILARLAGSASAPKRFVKFVLLLIAYAIVVVALANP